MTLDRSWSGMTAAKIDPMLMSSSITPKPDPNSARKSNASTTGIGPLASGTSTVASNNFAIPAFAPSPGGAPCTPPVAELLNTYAGGFDNTLKDQLEGAYYIAGGTNPDAAEQGWAQFSATTTVVTLALPVGPPPGFSF